MSLVRYCCWFCLVLIYSNAAFAQANFYEETPKPFTGGLAAGLNLAQVDGDTYFGYNKPGISAGAFVRIHFTQRLSGCMELLFSQKGSRGDAVIESPFNGTSVSRCHIGLSYVEIPVTLQYTYATIGVEAGMSYSVLVKTNEWILAGQQLAIDKVNNRFNTTDLNYVFGVSRKVYKQLYANVRFQYSVVSIRPFERIPAGYGYGNTGQFNNLFCIRLMYVL